MDKIAAQSLVFNAGVTAQPNNNGPTGTSGKKRVRRDPPNLAFNAPAKQKESVNTGKIMPSPSQPSQQGGPKVIMNGMTKVYALGDGTKSTLPLQQQTGSRYRILDDEDMGQSSTFDPGQGSAANGKPTGT